MFEAIYASGWHHPFVAWLATGLLFLRLGVRPPPKSFLRGYLFLFGVIISLDAMFTGAWNPLPSLDGAAIAFVILGDLRLFVLTERYSRRARGEGGLLPYVWAVAIALIVPILQGLGVKLFPSAFVEPRWIYVAYELGFVALALFYRGVVLPRRGLADPLVPWARSLVLFFLVQYVLWAASDLMILAGFPQAFLLRLVPNAMYYAGFLWFAWESAPKDAWVS